MSVVRIAPPLSRENGPSTTACPPGLLDDRSPPAAILRRMDSEQGTTMRRLLALGRSFPESCHTVSADGTPHVCRDWAASPRAPCTTTRKPTARSYGTRFRKLEAILLVRPSPHCAPARLATGPDRQALASTVVDVQRLTQTPEGRSPAG
jgi:hypothetical protein